MHACSVTDVACKLHDDTAADVTAADDTAADDTAAADTAALILLWRS